MASYTSYLSNILTHTTSRYNSLRKILLNNEDDGDTEDDSHVSRVLRAYYTEKGQTYPPWLPPDPNDRRAKPPLPSQQSSSYFTSTLGARNPYSNTQQANALSRGSGSLNDLWDAPAATPVSSQPQSLRAGRRVPAGARQDNAGTLAVPQARPLPSQRAGSYQTAQPYQESGPSGQSGYLPEPTPLPVGTAQERLKARLWGRSGSSTSVISSGQDVPYTQAPAGSPYDTAGNNRRQGRFG